MASVVSVPGIQRLSGAELRALAKAARSIGVPVDWLATIVSFETGGSFSPSQPNQTGSSAFGLIQFLPSTAANILGGTNADAAERGKGMGFAEQLRKMVIPYFRSFGLSFQSLQDLYLAVFYPRAMNKPADFVVASLGEKAYEQNKGFDKTGKGYITRGDITSRITAHYANASGRVTIPGGWFEVVAGIGIAGALLYAADKYLPPEARVPMVHKAVGDAKRIAEKGKSWLGKNIKAFSS